MHRRIVRSEKFVVCQCQARIGRRRITEDFRVWLLRGIYGYCLNLPTHQTFNRDRDRKFGRVIVSMPSFEKGQV